MVRRFLIFSATVVKFSVMYNKKIFVLPGESLCGPGGKINHKDHKETHKGHKDYIAMMEILNYKVLFNSLNHSFTLSLILIYRRVFTGVRFTHHIIYGLNHIIVRWFAEIITIRTIRRAMFFSA